MLQNPLEGTALVDGLAQLLVYQEPRLVIFGRELLLVMSLMEHLFAGELAEGTAVEVDFLHPVVHALAEGSVVRIHTQSFENEVTIARYVELSVHQPCLDEAVAEEHENALVIALMLAQAHLPAFYRQALIEPAESHSQALLSVQTGITIA